MFDIKSYDILSPELNSEIVEVVDRAWIKSSAHTKEQKEKNLQEIFHTYLDRLNKTLKQNESVDVQDLVLEKSEYILTSTGVSDWPGVETLKVTDLHRLTIFLYNYNKYRYALRSASKIKELQFKAFENLTKFFEVLVELSSQDLSEELLFTLFNDYFKFYVLSRQTSTDENKTKTEEDLFAILDMLYEETSI
jgi:hypothetical protein